MAARPKQAADNETSESIQAQIEAFIKDGGKIQKINTGVSGQVQKSGPKHITLGNKPRQ